MADDHLFHIDEHQWPDIAAAPQPGFRANRQARHAESEFSRVAEAAELTIGPGKDLTILYDTVFYRIAQRGWLGLAEGYAAGEWESDHLTKVLAGLLGANYRPQHRLAVRAQAMGEPAGIPRRLCELTSPTSSLMIGRFAAGVATTVGKRTAITAPGEVTRADVADSQERAADELLDQANVRSSDRVLELSLGAPMLAAQAASRGAKVTVVSPDSAAVGWMRSMELRDIAVERIANPMPPIDQVARRLSAIVAADYMVMLSPNQRAQLMRYADEELAPTGRMALQEFTRTSSPLVDHALQATRLYLQPSFDPVSGEEEMARLAGGTTRLALAHTTLFAGHIEPTLTVMADQFAGAEMLAGADGFDSVYRRLWAWHLAVLSALARQRLIGVAQFLFRPLARPR